MSLMQQRLDCVSTVSPRRRLGFLRPGSFPILVGLVSLALAELGVFTPSAWHMQDRRPSTSCRN